MKIQMKAVTSNIDFYIRAGLRRPKLLLLSAGFLLTCISVMIRVKSMISNGNIRNDLRDTAWSDGHTDRRERLHNPYLFQTRASLFNENNVTFIHQDTFEMSKYMLSVQRRIKLVRQRYVNLEQEMLNKYTKPKSVTNLPSPLRENLVDRPAEVDKSTVFRERSLPAVNENEVLAATVPASVYRSKSVDNWSSPSGEEPGEHHTEVDKTIVSNELPVPAVSKSKIIGAAVAAAFARDKGVANLEYIPSYYVPNISCAALFAGDTAERAKAYIQQHKYPKIPIKDSVYLNEASNCSHFIASRQYVMRPLSDEEASFSIAYSILMFRDVEQFERLLRSIYRPQNFYCIHVDQKSVDSLYKAVKKISSCFKNVFVTRRRVDVRWGTFSVVEPELICMHLLLRRSKRWRYFINLTGQEFPLKTNLDIVKILKAFNGSNNMEGTVARLDTSRFEHLPPPPLNIRLTKGSIHIAATRAFVKFVLSSNASRLFRDWVKDVFVPDETYFTSLNHNPHLGAPGAYLGEPETDRYRYQFVTRFKNWGDGPFNWPCHGKRVRNVCVFGIGDLPLLANRAELFANKFYIDYQPFTLDCLEELHYNRTRVELTGKNSFDVSFYKQLSFVQNHL